MVSTRSRGKTGATNESAEKPKLAEPMKKTAPKGNFHIWAVLRFLEPDLIESMKFIA